MPSHEFDRRNLSSQPFHRCCSPMGGRQGCDLCVAWPASYKGLARTEKWLRFEFRSAPARRPAVSGPLIGCLVCWNASLAGFPELKLCLLLARRWGGRVAKHAG